MSFTYSSSHDQITHKLNLACRASQQASERLNSAQQISLLNQRLIHEAEARVDQLLAKLKQPNYLLVSSTDLYKDYDSTASPKQPDIVEQLYRKIQQQNELVRQSAHDLRSSFGLMHTASDLLSQAETETDRQQMQDIIQRNLRQVSQLLTQLLDFTRLEAGEERRQLTTFDVSELLNDLLETVRPVAKEKSLWVQKRGVASLLIESDWVKLYRVAQNLLLNAIKYTREGGVTLSWESKEATCEWCLTITDTGPGLLAGTGHHSGEGIGLIIVNQLCAILNGQLSTKEAKEGGTQFTILLPLRYSESATRC